MENAPHQFNLPFACGYIVRAMFAIVENKSVVAKKCVYTLLLYSVNSSMSASPEQDSGKRKRLLLACNVCRRKKVLYYV